MLQGTHTFILQDRAGNIESTHSVSAGLDYAAVGPEHAWLHERGRAEYHHVSDSEALDAFQTLARTEGILPALESSHAIAHVIKTAASFGRDAVLLVNLSGRGDKDVQTVEKHLLGAGTGQEGRKGRKQASANLQTTPGLLPAPPAPPAFPAPKRSPCHALMRPFAICGAGTHRTHHLCHGRRSGH